MEKSTIIVRGSIIGIAGDFLKNVIILICTYVVYAIGKDVKQQYYEEFNITSLVDFAMEFKHTKEAVIISFIFLLFLILALIAISTIYKAFKLLYEIPKSITFDSINGKIIAVTYSFPFNKNVDENKFDEIIEVNISQGLLHRLFNSGDMYIEYLALNKIDSQLRHIEIPYISCPFKVKPRMM